MVLKITNLHILRYLPTCWLYLLECYTIDNQRCTHALENNKEYCTREDGKYKILLVKSTYINKEGKEKDILTYGILDVANKKYICYTANIDVAQRLERDWEFYNQITNPDFPDDPNRRLVCNSYTKKD